MPGVDFIVGAPKDPMQDTVFKQQLAHYAVQDEQTKFVKAEEVVQSGPSGQKQKHKIVLRYAPGQPFVFAAYRDNPEWQEAEDDHWFSTAKKAIDRFCAVKGYTTKHAPRAEPGQPYNVFVEVDRGITA